MVKKSGLNVQIHDGSVAFFNQAEIGECRIRTQTKLIALQGCPCCTRRADTRHADSAINKAYSQVT